MCIYTSIHPYIYTSMHMHKWPSPPHLLGRVFRRSRLRCQGRDAISCQLLALQGNQEDILKQTIKSRDAGT